LKDLEDQKILDLLKCEETKRIGFTQLVEKYQRSLYVVIRNKVKNHEDTNDVLQNTFIKVHRGISEFRGESKLYSWLYRIAVNESLSFLSKNKKRRADQTYDIDDYKNSVADDGQMDGDEVLKRLHAAIAELPKRQRQVFELRYFENLSYQQISERLNLSVGGLKASYHIAAKKIENYIVTSQPIQYGS